MHNTSYLHIFLSCIDDRFIWFRNAVQLIHRWNSTRARGQSVVECHGVRKGNFRQLGTLSTTHRGRHKMYDQHDLITLYAAIFQNTLTHYLGLQQLCIFWCRWPDDELAKGLCLSLITCVLFHVLTHFSMLYIPNWNLYGDVCLFIGACYFVYRVCMFKSCDIYGF